MAQTPTWSATETHSYPTDIGPVTATLEFDLTGDCSLGAWSGVQRFTSTAPGVQTVRVSHPIHLAFAQPPASGAQQVQWYNDAFHIQWFAELAGDSLTLYNAPRPNSERWRLSAPIQKADLRIVEPVADEKIAFDGSTPGVLTIRAAAETDPRGHESEIEWRVPDITGAALDVQPASRRGPAVTATYRGLPERNALFGRQRLTARFGGAGCGAERSVDVQIFFPRDAANNPGGTEPNWFYYWKQTQAFVGPGQYQDDREGCQLTATPDEDFRGYYRYDSVRLAGRLIGIGRDHYYICDLVRFSFRYECAFVDQCTTADGIDFFAIASHHENLHYEHFMEWWCPVGGWPIPDPQDGALIPQPGTPDQDSDRIPDTLEAALGFDPHQRLTHPIAGHPRVNTDEHYLTYRSAEAWPLGSADGEDWACPGHQWRDCPAGMVFLPPASGPPAAHPPCPPAR